MDARNGYRTRSILVVPLQDPSGNILGVLELINALDERGKVVVFDPDYEDLMRSLASQAAVAIRNTQLEEPSFKDGLTGVFNRRYRMLRVEEESKRHARGRQPVSLVLIDLDHFKEINDQKSISTPCRGHPEGAPFEHYGPLQSDEALRYAREIIEFARSQMA